MKSMLRIAKAWRSGSYRLRSCSGTQDLLRQPRRIREFYGRKDLRYFSNNLSGTSNDPTSTLVACGQASTTPRSSCTTMSKPISFGFGKPKAPANGPSKPTTSISIPSKRPSAAAKPLGLKSRSALHADDDEGPDEDEPRHESVTGFSTTGAILSKPIKEKKAVVIENQGNGDWRNRGRGGKNVLPEEERARRDGQDVVMVEKNEVSTASGLQFASSTTVEDSSNSKLQSAPATDGHQEYTKPKTVEEEALQALLNDDPNAPRGTTIISVSENKQLRPADELEDFRSDVASRPEVPTLDEYAAMPVEEFGLAMLRGMGKKRRANGEVINVEPEPEKKKETTIKKPKHEGFLGIGAKPAPGLEGVELGAWGKADMRKNNKGQGFFTPVMIRDRETGETITEEELERRKKSKGQKEEPEDWRTRRERDSEKDGNQRNGDGYKDAMNGFSRRRKDDDSGHESSISRRDKDKDRDSDYDKSRSKRPRSRSRDRRHRDDDRYDSGSSRRDKDRDHGRDRDRDRDRHRDRHKERDRDYDRDDRRHRDRR